MSEFDDDYLYPEFDEAEEDDYYSTYCGDPNCTYCNPGAIGYDRDYDMPLRDDYFDDFEDVDFDDDEYPCGNPNCSYCHPEM